MYGILTRKKFIRLAISFSFARYIRQFDQPRGLVVRVSDYKS